MASKNPRKPKWPGEHTAVARVKRKEGPNRERGVHREHSGRLGGAPHRTVSRSRVNKRGGGVSERSGNSSFTFTRAPRGSKKNTVGKSRHKYLQRGSYTTHGRR